jgi:hypothetical protein
MLIYGGPVYTLRVGPASESVSAGAGPSPPVGLPHPPHRREPRNAELTKGRMRAAAFMGLNHHAQAIRGHSAQPEWTEIGDHTSSERAHELDMQRTAHPKQQWIGWLSG